MSETISHVTIEGLFLQLKISAVKILSLLCVLVLVGCATYQRQQQKDRFEDITEAYGNAIRWGKFEVANGFRADTETEKKPDFEYLKNIRVTSYELKAVNVSGDGNTVQLDVEIEYYSIDRFIEKTIIDNQVWKYDTEAGTWSLHGELPDFK